MKPIRKSKLAALLAVGITIGAAPAQAACGDNVYYKIKLTSNEASATNIPMDKEAERAGGYRKLLDRDEADRKTLASDQDISGAVKGKALPFLDANIRNVRCMTASGLK